VQGHSNIRQVIFTLSRSTSAVRSTSVFRINLEAWP
jgi:hypothetical protein